MPPKPRKKNTKSRVVLDTNVLVAGISGFKGTYVSGKNPSADVLFRWADRDDFTWLTTEEILEEYKEVLKRRNVRPALIGKIINLIRERAEEVKVRHPTQVSPDPDDDAFCVCAEQGKADAIVTLNVKDFPQDRLKAKVFTPVDFLAHR
ncbi:MAG: putative toxin-antitoxin system toxin component, PIN family [Candidatus Acidiferrum sp.]